MSKEKYPKPRWLPAAKLELDKLGRETADLKTQRDAAKYVHAAAILAVTPLRAAADAAEAKVIAAEQNIEATEVALEDIKEQYAAQQLLIKHNEGNGSRRFHKTVLVPFSSQQ